MVDFNMALLNAVDNPVTVEKHLAGVLSAYRWNCRDRLELRAIGQDVKKLKDGVGVLGRLQIAKSEVPA